MSFILWSVFCPECLWSNLEHTWLLRIVESPRAFVKMHRFLEPWLMESAFLMYNCSAGLSLSPLEQTRFDFGSVKLPLLWVSEGCNNPSLVQTKEHGTDGLLEGSGSFCLVWAGRIEEEPPSQALKQTNQMWGRKNNFPSTLLNSFWPPSHTQNTMTD